MAYRDLDVLDAAERAADMLEALIARHPGRQLLHVSQMRRCIQSIAANIAEGFARGKARIATVRWKSRVGKRRKRSDT